MLISIFCSGEGKVVEMLGVLKFTIFHFNFIRLMAWWH